MRSLLVILAVASMTLSACTGTGGPTGGQGPSGPSGPQGEQGPQGVQGPPGDAGQQGLPGPRGDAGPQGAAGPSGPPGPTGATGGQGPKGMSWVGPWSDFVAYRPDDVVESGGSSYVALVATAVGSRPPGQQWSLVASAGAVGPEGSQGLKGDAGAEGPPGPSGPQGAVGAPGARGDVGATGPSGPQGDPGARGDQGLPGAPGDSVIGISLSPGDPDCPFGGSQFTSVAGVTLACHGAPGEVGAQGPSGPPGIVAFGATAGTAAEGNDPRLSDERWPLAGSAAYIQSGTSPQAASFSVTGTASVGGSASFGSDLAVAGNLGVGVASPAASLDLGARTDGIVLPRGTEASRPAAPVAGLLRFNTATKLPEFFDGGRWVALGVARVSGGVVTEAGGYRIHTFTSTGTFQTDFPLTVDVLVVGGGGSGGMHTTTNANGGGGGGGVVQRTGYALATGSYAVVVGAGGPAIPSGMSSPGANGQNSTFGPLVALGGGGGGSSGAGPGQAGGSGGGGAFYNPAGGSATQPAAGGAGNRGGAGNQTWTGGGGGGAGSAGVDGNAGGGASPAGNGGAGLASDISGALQFYAGGGGGGGNSSERAGDGMDGGGRGAGTTSFYGYTQYPTQTNATTRGSGTPNAIPNTGGGGGGGSYWSVNAGWLSGSGAGGSGIVIVRYLIP